MNILEELMLQNTKFMPYIGVLDYIVVKKEGSKEKK
jgi:hypothetical protein